MIGIKYNYLKKIRFTNLKKLHGKNQYSVKVQSNEKIILKRRDSTDGDSRHRRVRIEYEKNSLNGMVYIVGEDLLNSGYIRLV